MRNSRLSVGFSRRSVLKTAVGGITAIAGISSGVAGADDDVEMVFEDQESDGDAIELDYLRTEVDGTLSVFDTAAGENEYFGDVEVPAGTDTEGFSIPLEQSIDQSMSIRLLFFDGDPFDDADVLAQREAYVAVGESLGDVGTQFIEPTDGDDFNYPYYLFVPPAVEDDVPMLVEPNNTGTSTDDFEEHRSAAEQLISSSSTQNLSQELGVPMLVPVFPRPREEPVDWTHYTHQLDRETLAIEDTDLERIDLQLLAMIDHAREQFEVSLREKVMLNGFSASGNFCDRFTILHPERVLSVTAGGLNGMAVLPVPEYEGKELPYHVGVGDIEGLTGDPLNEDALDETNQFLYMGAEDDNDTIPFGDAWTEDDLRQLALDVYGDDMIAERFPTCQSVYETAGIEAQFRIYPDAGHTPRPAIDDIREFHRRSMRGEDVSGFGDQIVFDPDVQVEPETPAADEAITFDASASTVGVSELISFTWEFDDGSTAVGETVTHTYTESDTYAVELTVIDEHGTEHNMTFSLELEGADGADSETTEDETDTPTATADSETSNESTETETESVDATETPNTETSEVDDNPTDSDDEVPGFGILSAAAGLGGASYLLRERRNRDTET